jgi:di/tricarboxylate transporter
LLLLTRVVRERNVYRALDGPVLVVLGALIPVGQSLEALCLSDVFNNASSAVVMAPIAATIAAGLDVSADPFSMAVSRASPGYVAPPHCGGVASGFASGATSRPVGATWGGAPTNFALSGVGTGATRPMRHAA